MGGRIKQLRDPSGKWRSRVTELADNLGFPPGELWHYYEQLACMVEHEMRVSRPVSEDSAWRLLRGCFDKLAVANETDGWCT